MIEEVLHPTLTKLADVEPLRACGSCSLCCKLVPVASPQVVKDAGVWCDHCTKPGCAIYATRPMPCRVWSCCWLLDANLSEVDALEPRKCHVVIDPVCDEVIFRSNSTGEEQIETVVQMWCDPAYPGAWRSPAVRAAIDYYGKRMKMATIIRFNNKTGFLVRPPSLSPTGTWEESEQAAPIDRNEMRDKLKALDGGDHVYGEAHR